MTTSADVPARFPVAIDGHNFLCEPDFERVTVDVIRQQADQSFEPGEQCVDSDTEILTARGWLSCDQLDIGDWALTLDHETGLSEWQQVDAVSRYQVERRMMLALDGKTHSSLSTGEHRWPVLHTHNPEKPPTRLFLTSAELSWGSRFTTAAYCASLPTEPKFSDELVELIAWFWTEGNYSYGAGRRIRRVTIAQSYRVNPEKTDRIRACLVRMLGPERRGWWHEYRYEKKGVSHFQLTPEAAQGVIDAMAKTKVVQPSFLTSLTSSQLELFIRVSILGDGNTAGPGKASYYLFQKYRDMLSSFQMALVLAGWRNSMIQTPKGWRLAFTPRQQYAQPILNARDKRRTRATMEWVPYTGTIWCPSTANATWLARRRGTVYFTGNSLSPYGLWRRSQESWHHGAGQSFLDGRTGRSAYTQVSQDPEQFRSSKGIDPWTRGQLSLLRPTIKAWSTTNTNLFLAVAGLSPAALHVADGTEVYSNRVPYGGLNTLALGQGGGWTPTNATIAVYNVTRFTLTATSAAAVSAASPTGTNGMPVDPGRKYQVVLWTQYVSGGGGKLSTIAVTWYTAAGATISTVSNTSGLSDAGAGSVVSFAPAAPANAAFASVAISFTANWSNGEIHRILQVNIAPYDATIGFEPDNWLSASINAGQAAQTVQALATDGYYVWAALGTSGLHRVVGGAEVTTADVPAAPAGGQISLAGYANGFLLAAGSDTTTYQQNVLWLVNDPLGTPALSVVKTHPNPNFIWTGIGPGRGCVYVWGNVGGNGEVYKILFDPNTGTLSAAASFATYLPDGETIHALQFYAGGIILGTGKGLRLGQADGTGNIDYGPLVPTTWPVRCLEPQDRYCWFGWTKYDTTNSGLGRVDLGFFTDTMTPAWAADLMTYDASNGDVVGCVTFSPYGYGLYQKPPVRAFTVAGQGVYIEDPASRVATGNLQTGTIRFATSEPKTTRSVDLRHHALPAGATVAVEMQRDTSGTWEALGSSAVTASYGPATPIDALSETAESMEFRLTLTRPTPAGTDYSISPELTRWTAKVLPTPSTIDETFTLTLKMDAQVETNEGESVPVDVPTEVAFIKGLEQTRRLVTLQLGSDSFTVYVVKSQFKARSWFSPAREYAEGALTVVCQSVRG